MLNKYGKMWILHWYGYQNGPRYYHFCKFKGTDMIKIVLNDVEMVDISLEYQNDCDVYDYEISKWHSYALLKHVMF